MLVTIYNMYIFLLNMHDVVHSIIIERTCTEAIATDIILICKILRMKLVLGNFRDVFIRHETTLCE